MCFGLLERTQVASYTVRFRIRDLGLGLRVRGQGGELQLFRLQPCKSGGLASHHSLWCWQKSIFMKIAKSSHGNLFVSMKYLVKWLVFNRRCEERHRTSWVEALQDIRETFNK